MTTFAHPAVAAWFENATRYDSPGIQQVAATKRARGLTVGVCLPALNEAATIGPICDTISTTLVSEGVVDQLVVIDSGSQDDTARIAGDSGASVFAALDLVPEAGTIERPGKGESLWKSLSVMTTDIVVWLDSDTKNFAPHFVTSLTAPLLEDDNIVFTKAFYDRPLDGADGLLPMGGARVTEIAVRPLINLLYPELAGFIQPLSGEYAGRRQVLVDLHFGTGYDVDLLMLMELVEVHGLSALAQVDLGSRLHRNRDIPALGRMSFEIVHTLLEHLDEKGRLKLPDELPGVLMQFTDLSGSRAMNAYPARSEKRPAMSTFLKD
ncbi:MAG: glucosyl-3-phosphoglycerate synthase [Actinomycetota bacterium]|jgi:glucosyl-3-phosphoglycerate synthase|nr:glucosyl-3-phosphoglycerate synthase [Actinomycetota bacterium]